MLFIVFIIKIFAWTKKNHEAYGKSHSYNNFVLSYLANLIHLFASISSIFNVMICWIRVE